MKRHSKVLVGAVVAMVALALAGNPAAGGPAGQRPLSDFLDTQGSANDFDPAGNFWGWIAPAPGVKTPTSSYVGGNAAVCDYAGLENKYLVANGGPDLGTSFTGSVKERPLKDGRIEVSVELHTKNALVWGTRITAPDFGDAFSDPVIFGARPDDVLNGATPAIGECHSAFTWKQAPGELIDFCKAFEFPDVEVVNWSFRANGSGPLTAVAGLGPDGTPGRLFISQTGFFRTSFMGATADAFPAEIVEVRKVGK